MNRSVYLGELSVDVTDGRTVITPNEKAAATLDVDHASLEGLAREVVGEERIANPLLVWRALREAVEEALGSRDSAGTARSLLPIIRELFRSGAELDHMPNSKRARRIMNVAKVYRGKLRELGVLDPAEVLQEASRLRPERRAVALSGYPRLGRDELAFLEAVAGGGSVVCLPHALDGLFAENESVGAELAEAGWSVQRSPLERVWRTEASTEGYVYPNLDAEVRGTLSRVKELLAGGVPAREIALVARDDASYGPSVMSVAREYGVPVAALYRVPVTGTRVGHWLDLLLEASQAGFPFEPTVELLSRPLGPGLPWKNWGRARRRRPADREAWAECGIDLSPFDLRELWPEEDSWEGWGSRIVGLLEVYELPRKVGPWPRERVALGRIQEAFGLLAEVGVSQGPVSRETAVGEIREKLRSTATPVLPEGAGVELHTPLSIFGASYRFIFALGLVEGEFPAQVRDDPVLDFHERRRLQDEGVRLELAAERAQRERLSFWSMLQVPTERLILSYPQVSGNRELLPSPYFGLLGVSPAPPEPRPAASEVEARRAYLRREPPAGFEDPIRPRARHAWEVERRRESSSPFDAHDGILHVAVDRDERRFSASQLADLVRCGFKWWAGSVLRLSEPEEGEESVSIGRLYHRTLELAAHQARGGSGALQEELLRTLEDAFAQAEEEFGLREQGSWEARRGPHLEELRQAVEREDFASEGAEILAVEQRFEGDWRGFSLSGRLDRVDETPLGLELLDYKSGSGVPKPDLQLAIYREAAAPALFPEKPVSGAFYYSIGKGKRLSAKPPDETELAELLDRVKTNLEAGRLPPDVLEGDPAGKPCEWCDFDLVCRRGSRLSRKLSEGSDQELPQDSEYGEWRP